MMTRTCRLIIVLVLAGCADSKGFDRAALHDRLQQDTLRQIDSATRHDQRPPLRLTLPAKFALYLKPTRFLNRRFDWTDADKETFRTWANELKSRGLLSDFYVVAESSITDKQNLRDVAARYGADVLLIVAGVDAVDRYNNYKGPLLYWTLVGAYFADGTISDALCLVTASLWDVRTGASYFTEEAEGQAKTVGPAALVDDKDAVAQAKTTALKRLIDRLEDRLVRFSTTP